MIVIAYLIAAHIPGPWSDWMGVFGIVAAIDAVLMLADLPLRLWNTIMSYVGLSQL